MSEFAKMLVENDCVITEGSKSLSGGGNTEIYVDLRRSMGDPLLYACIRAEMISLLTEVGSTFDSIAGSGTAAVMAFDIAMRLARPFSFVRQNTKSHGTMMKVEGYVGPESRVLVIDDVLTTGNTVLWMANHLEALHMKVVAALVSVDRRTGMRRSLDDRIQVVSACTMDDILTEMATCRPA